MDVKNHLKIYWRRLTLMSQISMNCVRKIHLKNEIDLKKVNNEKIMVIEKLISENVTLKNTQEFSKQEITEEFKDFVNNEVMKAWKEEKEKDKISFREIFEIKEMESKVRMEKEVIKVLKTNENIV